MSKDFDIEKPKKRKKKSLLEFYSTSEYGYDFDGNERARAGSEFLFDTPIFDVYAGDEIADLAQFTQEIKRQTSPSSSLQPVPRTQPAPAVKPASSEGRMNAAEAIKLVKQKKDAQKKSYLEYMALKRHNFRTVKTRDGRRAHGSQYKEIETAMKQQRIDWGTPEFVALVHSFFPEASLSVTQSVTSSILPKDQVQKEKDHTEFMEREMSVATDHHELTPTKDTKGKNLLNPTNEEKKEAVPEIQNSPKEFTKSNDSQEPASEKKEKHEPGIEEKRKDSEEAPGKTSIQEEEQSPEDSPEAKEHPELKPAENASKILEVNASPLPETEEQKLAPEAVNAMVMAKKEAFLGTYATVKSALNASLLQRKEGVQQKFLQQQLAMKEDAAAKSVAVKTLFNSSKKELEASYQSSLALAKASLQKSLQEVESKKAARLSALAQTIAGKKKAFETYISEKEREPEAHARQEGQRIQSELSAAAETCIQQGHRAAAQFSEKDSKDAAMIVSQESAKDIRAKIQPMKQNLLDLGVELKGNYSEYKTQVFAELDKAEAFLKPQIEKRAEDLKSKLQKDFDAVSEQLAQAKTKDLSSLQAQEQSTLQSLQRASAQSLKSLSQAQESANAQLDKVSQLFLSAADQIQSDTLAAMQGDGEWYLPGIEALLQDASSRLATLSGEGASQLSQLQQGFGEVSTEFLTALQSSTLASLESAQSAASKLKAAAQKRNGEWIKGLEERSKSSLQEFDKDVKALEEKSVGEMDASIGKIKEKIEAQNSEAKEKISARCDENIEKAKMPLLDDNFDRSVEAGKEADPSVWDIVAGVFSALLTIALVFVVLVVVAALIVAGLAALGFTVGLWAVVGVIGLGLLAYMAYQSYQTRSAEGYSGWKLVGLVASDAIGFTDLYEGISDKSIANGKKLNQSWQKRSERTTMGAFSIVMTVLGVRGSIKGFRTKAPVAPKAPTTSMGRGVSKVMSAINKGATKVEKIAQSIGNKVGTKLKTVKFGDAVRGGVGKLKNWWNSKRNSNKKNTEVDETKTNQEQNNTKEEDLRRQQEEEARRQQEEELRKQQEEEAKQKAEEEARRQQEEEARSREEENKAKEQEEKAKVKKDERPTKPKVKERDFGDIEAKWDGDSKAYALFEPKGNDVHVSDIFRGSQPKGSAGIMLADSLKAAGINKPNAIRFTNILETQPTLAQLQEGIPVSETVLGKTLLKAVEELGGVVKGWKVGEYRGKQWIEAVIEYPTPKTVAPDLLPVEDRPTNPDVLNTKETPKQDLLGTEEVNDPEGILKKEEPEVIKLPNEEIDYLYREDGYMHSKEGSKPGRLKSHIDADGNLRPANPEGKATIRDHIRGAEPRKSDSPYTSFKAEEGVGKSYGSEKVKLDLKKLREDIKSGELGEVEIIEYETIRQIQEEAVAKAQQKYDSNPSAKNLESLEAAKRDLTNSARDKEFLIKGVIPKKYFKLE